MKKSAILFGITLLIMGLASCDNGSKKQSAQAHADEYISDGTTGWCKVTETPTLRIYTPTYKNIHLYLGPQIPDTVPEASLCVGAAYSILPEEPRAEDRVSGDFVSEGKLHKTIDKRKFVNSYFVYYDDKFKIVDETDSMELLMAARKGGTGFGQDRLIRNGEVVKSYREKSNLDRVVPYRALCILKDTLRVIESLHPQRLQTFQRQLKKLGVKEALYIVKGEFGYGWYQDKNGFKEIYPQDYSDKKYTNFLVFSMQ